MSVFFFFQAEDGIRDGTVTGVQTCALPILGAIIGILANCKSIKAYALWSPAIYTNRDMYPRYNTPSVNEDLVQKGFFTKSGIEVGPGFLQDLKENSALEKIRELSKPVLLVHGEADTRIPVSSTREAASLFRRRPGLCIIPGAGHSFKNDPVHRSYAFSATVQFFERHLTNHRAASTNQSPRLFEDLSDPAKNGKQVLQL